MLEISKLLASIGASTSASNSTSTPDSKQVDGMTRVPLDGMKRVPFNLIPFQKIREMISNLRGLSKPTDVISSPEKFSMDVINDITVPSELNYLSESIDMGMVMTKNTSSYEPKVGDILIFPRSRRNPFGHVAVVSHTDTRSPHIKLSEMTNSGHSDNQYLKEECFKGGVVVFSPKNEALATSLKQTASSTKYLEETLPGGEVVTNLAGKKARQFSYSRKGKFHRMVKAFLKGPSKSPTLARDKALKYFSKNESNSKEAKGSLYCSQFALVMLQCAAMKEVINDPKNCLQLHDPLPDESPEDYLEKNKETLEAAFNKLPQGIKYFSSEITPLGLSRILNDMVTK